MYAAHCELQAASCEDTFTFTRLVWPFCGQVIRLCAGWSFLFYTHTRAHQQPAGTSTHHTPATHSSTMWQDIYNMTCHVTGDYVLPVSIVKNGYVAHESLDLHVQATCQMPAHHTERQQTDTNARARVASKLLVNCV